jgi:dipeptidyl aminopeptidase/acylaminoacyl peptidase
LRVSPEDFGLSAEAFRAAADARVNQEAKLRRYKGPLLVLHTAADQLIPPSHAERLVAWSGAPAADKTLVMFDRGDHGTIYPENRTAYLGQLAAFLARIGAS